MSTKRGFPVPAILAIAFLAVLVAVVGLARPAPVAADEPGFEIMPKNGRYEGKTYAEWVRLWHKWTLKVPAGDNPIFDETGADCAEGQDYPVWFLTGVLGGGTVERHCTVPEGTPVFFPVQNAIWFPWSTDPPMSEEEQQYYERAFRQAVNQADATAIIDDVRVNGLRRWHFNSGWFDAWVPDDNIIDFLWPDDSDWPEGDSGPHYNDGLYLLVFLEEGNHEIRFTGWDGGLDVTYGLEVQ